MRWLQITCWALFVASFFVTAVTFDMDSFLGWRIDVHDRLPGWCVAWICLKGIAQAGKDFGDWLCVLYVATNILVVVSPVAFFTKRGGRWHWLAHAMLGATLLNVSVMWSLEGLQAIGYYLWLASFIGLTICLYSRSKVPAGREA